MLPALRAASNVETQNDWDKQIKKLEQNINATVSKATGKTPFEALYGYLPRFEDANTREITKHCETYTVPTEIQKEIRNNICEAQKTYKKQFDAKRFKGVKYSIGDIVFIKRDPKQTGKSRKLQRIFGVPMVVIEVLPSDTYRIKKLNESNDKKFESTAHVSQMKIWKGNQESDSNSETDDSSDESISLSNNHNNTCEATEVNEKNLCNEQERCDKLLSANENGNIIVNQNRKSVRERKAPAKLKDYTCY
uniref:Uncharacterized protein n=1 Tax=Trichogramma kaykai TaxID=54128 RepID=A0ABD2X0D7_9HYME